MDINSQINKRPMTAVQYGVILICYFLNMLDGVDVLVVSYAAPLLAQEWAVEPQVLGMIFSAGLVGMTLGALFIGPYTDVYGRRRMLLCSVVVVSSGLILSAFCQSTLQLSVMRFYTGLGIGTMLASLASMASEYAPEHRRNLIVALVYSGYPIGATLSGFVSVWVLPTYGWTALFLGAGIITALMLPIMWFFLPESLEFLAVRQPAGALKKINRTLRKMHFDPISALPPKSAASSATPGVKVLFSEGYAYATIKLWCAFCFGLLTLYFLLSWIPTLASNAGLALEQAIYAGAVFNLGAVIGVACIGTLSKRINIQLLIMIFMLAGAVIMIFVGAVQVSVSILLLELFILGITGHAGFIALYSVAADLYPATIRSTGIGWAIGAGRVGGVIGPMLGGLLIAMGIEPLFSFVIFALPMALAGIAIFLIGSNRMADTTT